MLGICFDMWLKASVASHAHCQKDCSQVTKNKQTYLLASHKKYGFILPVVYDVKASKHPIAGY